MSAPKFLIDVNLPKYFQFFHSPEFLFVVDMDLSATDDFLWNYALEKNLIIVTKDTDFYNKFLISKKSPGIIFVKLGNCSLKQLHTYFQKHWKTCAETIQTANLIILHEDKLEIIISQTGEAD